MLSLIRKISSTQQPKTDPSEQKKKQDDDVGSANETQEHEEIDGTTYDPDADPRDPGKYYTFPHFSADSNSQQQDPVTPQHKDQEESTKSDRDDNDVPDEQEFQDHKPAQTPPASKSMTEPTSPEPASPPFWPLSPLAKRHRSSCSPDPRTPVVQRRATTNSASSLQNRVQTPRRASASVQYQQYRSPSGKQYSSPPSSGKQYSPAARSLRSISVQANKKAEFGGGKGEAKSPTRKAVGVGRGAGCLQGSPRRESGRNEK